MLLFLVNLQTSSYVRGHCLVNTRDLESLNAGDEGLYANEVHMFAVFNKNLPPCMNELVSI